MAGIAAQHRGPTGPFELSTLFLGLGGLLTTLLWNKNRGESQQQQQQQQKPLEGGSTGDKKEKNEKKQQTTMRDAITICLNDPKIILVGSVQALFEAAMYIFVLQWPPVMSKAIDSFYSVVAATATATSSTSVGVKPPYGTIFSCFMACCLLGSTLFGQSTRMNIPTEQFTTSFLGIAAIAMSISTWTVLQPSTVVSLPLLTGSFFIFEAAVGMYFPSIGTLRSRFVPDSHRSLIMNLFGIPLNVIVVNVFLSLHKLGVSGALSISSIALVAATGCMIQLQRLLRKEKREEKIKSKSAAVN